MLNRAIGIEERLLELDSAIDAARERLLKQLQRVELPERRDPDSGELQRAQSGGYWIGELEADTTLESDYILFLHFLGGAEKRKIEKLARYVRKHQQEDGTWSIWYGGRPDLSASVKAYVALRLAGNSTDEPFMIRAREAIIRLGGVEKVNSFTSFYLALLGQFDWDDVPAIPPEVVLLPRFFYINIYEISYWSRAILVPLSILYAKRTARPPSGDSLIADLFADPEKRRKHLQAYTNGTRPKAPAFHLNLGGSSGGSPGTRDGDGRIRRNGSNGCGGSTEREGSAAIAHERARAVAHLSQPRSNGTEDLEREEQAIISWENFFLLTDRILKLVEKTPVKPLRKLALKKAEEWMVSRFEDSDGLGAIFPSMVNSVMALIALGYPSDHPLVLKTIKELEQLEIEEDDEMRLQPCLSPIWDTAKAINALHEAGVPSDDERLAMAGRWLVSKEVRKPGDWKIRVPHVDVGGWYFQFRNEFYPDIDDTGAVVMALGRLSPERVEGIEDSIARGVEWTLNMQCSDGGWAAFDVDVQREVLTKVPYADHNAMLDPPCADITGRCLEMFGRLPSLRRNPRVERSIRQGVEFLKATQEEDGAWYGRWGVNYIYGTWQALKGLMAVGEDPAEPYIRKAVDFLKSRQNPDGGWGESCASYEDPSYRGRGESTASQTGWALMGLIAAGEADSAAAKRGIDYLLERQNAAGTWEEKHWTGTGFPRVFYLKYHLYALYFPLFALAMYRNAKLGISTVQDSAAIAERIPHSPPAPRKGAIRSLFA